jgi:hypothetical protein
MWELLLWLSPIIVLIAWHIYKAIKAREERVYIPSKAIINRCEHVDEPNHDRIICYARQATVVSIIPLLPLLLFFLPTGR